MAARGRDPLRMHLNDYLIFEAKNPELAAWSLGREILGLREVLCSELVWDPRFEIIPEKLNRLRSNPIDPENAPPLVVRLEENGLLGVADGVHRVTVFRELHTEKCFAVLLRA